MIPFARPADTPSRRWPVGLAAAAVASLGLHLLALLINVVLPGRPIAAPAALSVRLSVTPPPAAASPAGRPSAATAPDMPPRQIPLPWPARPAAAPPRSAALRIEPPGEPATITARPQATPAPVVPPAPSEPFLPASFAADYLNNPPPAYPSISRRAGEQGRVVLSVRVGARGDVLAVAVDQSSGRTRLDAAAIAAVERWRFIAARLGDAPVESTVLVPLRFSLGDE